MDDRCVIMARMCGPVSRSDRTTGVGRATLGGLSLAVAWTLVLGVVSAWGVVPNDSRFARQWSLHNTGQSLDGIVGAADADVDAVEAWDLTTGSSSVIVAGVDDGVDAANRDLAPNLVAGYDFGNADSDPNQTVCCHGSQTLALIGARGNDAFGIAGLNWKVGLMALKVRTDGPGERFDLMEPKAIADAFRYAGSHGARVVNASFGLRSTTTSTERAAVLAAIQASPNTLFVTSAGNSAIDVDSHPRYPCSFKEPNLLCVAGTDYNDTLWIKSSFGAQSVQLAAPATRIQTLSGRDTYGYVEGTSYAAPLVAGTAALYFARYPDATVADARNALLTGTDRLPSLTGKTQTGGRLNTRTTLTIPPAGTPTPGPGDDPGEDPGAGRLRLRLPHSVRASAVARRGLKVVATAPARLRVKGTVRLGRRVAHRLRVRRLVGSAKFVVHAGPTKVRVRLRRAAFARAARGKDVVLRVLLAPRDPTAIAPAKRRVRMRS
jgi:hypothetical protein